MIYEALATVRSQLLQYLQQNNLAENSEKEVVLGNISEVDGTATGSLSQKIIISLISLENDATLKNGPTRYVEANRVRKENRPVHVNAYVLITAYYPGKYDNALKRLSLIIKFFQGKAVFTKANSPLTEIEDSERIDELKVNVELVSASFEQQNHIWGMLGGKSYPAALYKFRMLELKRDAPQEYETPIKHIIIND